MDEKKGKYVRKVNITSTLVGAYKFYKKNRKNSVIDYKLYVDICYTFNKEISNKIITESTEFKIPYGLGMLRIKSIRNTIRVKNGVIENSRIGVDWKRTKEMYMQLYGTNNWDELKLIPNKKVVLHTNEHSNGYRMKWYWNKGSAYNFANKKMYSFIPIKGCLTKDGYYTGRRGLSAWIKNEERTNEYYL